MGKAIDTNKYDYDAILREIMRKKEKLGLSISKISDAAGVSTYTVSHLCRGAVLSEKTLYKITSAMGVDMLKYRKEENKKDVKVFIKTEELESVLMPVIKKCLEEQFEEFLKTHAKKRRWGWN